MPYKYNFKEIAENIDIADVAAHLKLKFARGRADCPACDSERAIEIMEETNTFACYAADAPIGRKHLGGDCISLYAHVMRYNGSYRAAKELSELFGAIAPTDRSTVPPRTLEGRANAPAAKKDPVFDPESFAAKLVYSEEVKAIGLSEEDAIRLQIGFHPQRKRVYLPIRNIDGSLAGFIGYSKDGLKMPPKWITSNIVALKRA